MRWEKITYMNKALELLNNSSTQNTSLTEELANTAEEYEMEDDQIRRLAEYINKANFAYHFNTQEDKTFSFKPVDASEVIFGRKKVSTPLESDYVVKKAEFLEPLADEFSYGTQPMTKVAQATDWASRIDNPLQDLMLYTKNGDIYPDSIKVANLRIDMEKYAEESKQAKGSFEEAVEATAALLDQAANRGVLQNTIQKLTKHFMGTSGSSKHMKVLQMAIRKVKEKPREKTASLDVADIDSLTEGTLQQIVTTERKAFHLKIALDNFIEKKTLLKKIAFAFPVFWQEEGYDL